MIHMTIATVRGRLHEYIDHADKEKIKAIYTLVEAEITDRSYIYNEQTLDILRATSEGYASGKINGSPASESMARIRKYISKK
jgi:hypothetical protein